MTGPLASTTDRGDKASVTGQSAGMWLGLLAVTAFGLTLPATRQAVTELNPLFIGFGRSALAGIIALVLLRCSRSRLPHHRQLLQLLTVACGVVLGFPLLSALGMQTLPASHGGVMLGILPLTTAALAALMTHERNSPLFWGCSLLGALVVIGYAGRNGVDGWQPGDWWLLAAVLLAAWGYALGGQLSKELGGWQVICWALVLVLPVTLPLSLWQLPDRVTAISTLNWGCFLYLALVSQLLGFFAWNRGLALGGITRVSQIQLLQPFITLLASALLLSEAIDASTLGCAMLVVVLVAVSYRCR